MFLTRWLGNTTRTPKTRRAGYRPKVECLEGRDVPSAGFLDPTFAGDGVAVTPVGITDRGASPVAVYPGAAPAADGKVVVGGYAAARMRGGFSDYDFALVRYNPDGTPDPTFGQNGRIITNVSTSTDAVNSVRLVGTKVLAGGYSESGGFALARYTDGGAPDTSFGTKGVVTAKVNRGGLGQAMEVDAAGRIVMAGTDGNGALAVLRFTAAGAPDGAFGRNGFVTSVPARASGGGGQMGVAITPATAGADAGKMVVVGVRADGTDRVFVARFTAAGSADPAFGSNGVVDLPVSGQTLRPAVAVQPDGRVVVAVRQDVFRLTPAGAADPSFDGDGRVTTARLENASAVAVLPDGRLLVAGIETVDQGYGLKWRYFVARYTAEGVPDPTFGDGGVGIETEADPGTSNRRAGLAVQANGRAVVAGTDQANSQSNFTVMRFDGDPALVAASAAPNHHATTITVADARPLWAEAVRRWAAAGADVAPLAGADVRVADLGGATLGLAVGNTVWLDDNAAGWGWFVDSTPWDNAEFTTAGDQGEQNRIDLLSVLEHEIGHLLGYEHGAGGVMQETLAPGERLAPSGGSIAPDFWLIDVDGTHPRDQLVRRA